MLIVRTWQDFRYSFGPQKLSLALELIEGSPQGHRMGIVPFLCGGREDYMMTVPFPCDIRKVSVRTVLFCRRKKSQVDRKGCKHIRHSLEPPKMPEKPYRKSQAN